MNDAGAFLGSAGEIIFKKMSLLNMKYIYLESNENIIIINGANEFLAFNFEGKIDENKFFSVFSNIITPDTDKTISQVEEDDGMDDLMNAASAIEDESPVDQISEIERKLFNAKIVQINYLIDEFTGDGDKTKWLNAVKEKINEMEKINEALDVADMVSLRDIVGVKISKEEIQADSKNIIDSLCKLAVKEFGAKEAKQKVQNVIMKLNKR